MVSLYCGIFKRCQNVVFFEGGIVLKYFLLGSAGAKQAQNICDTNAKTPNQARPSGDTRSRVSKIAFGNN